MEKCGYTMHGAQGAMYNLPSHVAFQVDSLYLSSKKIFLIPETIIYSSIYF